MFGKEELKRKIVKLECRVDQLEFLICGGNHQWGTITEHFVPDIGGGSTSYEYQCKKCGKIYKKYGL